MKNILTILSTVMLLSACTGTPVQLGTKSSEPVPIGTERVITAEACGFQLLLFIPIRINDRLERAYKKIESQASGDFITDVRVQESWGWRFVGTSYCTTLHAKAVQRKFE
jgi:hypothetical protein